VKSFEIKEQILKQIEDYYNAKKEEDNTKFVPGISKINYAGRVFDKEEIQFLVKSSLDFYLTPNKYCKNFEEEFAKITGSKYCYFVNSGSSANLTAFLSLTSPELNDKRIKRGDEVITVAYTFPTTISPIIQYGAIPVFVDIKFDNIDETQLELSLSKKTKAVFIAHTLGNPFNVKAVRDFCDKHNLWLIQDSCDSLGAKYDNKNIEYYGDIITYSFYPAHHITCGQGGMVATNCEILSKIIHSMRDWGRYFKCNICISDCKKRYNYESKLEEYDCRYTYSHFGLNVAATEMQASIGLAQLKKLPYFLQKREDNFNRLWKNLEDLQDYIILPKATENSIPSRFAFLIILQKNIPFKRIDLIKYLEEHNIETRMLFAGNILEQKCFEHLVKDVDYRQIGELPNTNYMAKNSFFVGIYPGLDFEQIDYIGKTIHNFILTYK